MDKNVFWDTFLKNIEETINIQSFNTWFKPLDILEIKDNTIFISVPKAYFSSWLEEHYMTLIHSVAKLILGFDLNIVFIVKEKDNISENNYVSLPEKKDSFPSFFEQLSINKRFTFNSFVVGNSNQFAFAASKAVAESPGTTAFNPLVIYGGVGLGKTHLIQAIALHCFNSDKFINKKNSVIYVSSEKFTTDFIMSLQNNNAPLLSKYYQSSDILLVDDIQFFNNKERTQEEFFHIFNALHQRGKQIVLTMDCPPSHLKGLADRLINRFQWGLVTDIQPPDFETRVAILMKKAEKDGVFLDSSVADFIAENIPSNIRELEGSLIRLLAYSSLHGKDISLNMASEILGDTFRKKTSLITIEFIQKIVASHFSLSISSLSGNSRRKEIAVSRHIAIYLCKQLTDSSLKTIGLNFGGRDHSTVIHSINMVEHKYLLDFSLSNQIKILTEKIKSS